MEYQEIKQEIEKFEKRIKSLKEMFLNRVIDFSQAKEDYKKLIFDILSLRNKFFKGNNHQDKFKSFEENFLIDESFSATDFNVKLDELSEFLQKVNPSDFSGIREMASFISSNEEDFDPFSPI